MKEPNDKSGLLYDFFCTSAAWWVKNITKERARSSFTDIVQ